MTTITLERAFMIRVLEQLDVAQALLERSQHHAKIAAMYEELRAALAPPATAPDELERKPSAKEIAWDRIWSSLVIRNAQITIGDVADTMDWQLKDAMKGTP